MFVWMSLIYFCQQHLKVLFVGERQTRLFVEIAQLATATATCFHPNPTAPLHAPTAQPTR